MKINGTLTNTFICKRDGRVVPFEAEKITFAIFKALRATGNPDRQLAGDLMLDVLAQLNLFDRVDTMPAVEDVQDNVETVLFEKNHTDTAKAMDFF